MAPGNFFFKKKKQQKAKAAIVVDVLNMYSCGELKINEARDHLFFTIMSRSGAIIF